MKTKSNKQFMLMSAFGIFFVVDMHAGLPFNIFGTVFDYESYFMQMFVFISGYFFNPQNLEKPFRYLLRNTKKLIVPYILLNALYTGLIFLLKQYNHDIIWDTRFSLFTEGRDTALTLPAWFIPMLYFVIVSYVLLRLVFRRWNSWIAFYLLAIIGTVSVYFSGTRWNTDYTVLLLKIGFFLQFYELGILYKNSLESYFKKTSKLKLAALCTAVNILLIIISDNNMKCKYLYKMTGFLTDIYVLPLLTGITGICFWLCITHWLAPALGESRLVNYISNHTYAIVFHHLSFFVLLTYVLSKIPMYRSGFNYRNFCENAGWYKYDVFEGIRFIYVLFALFGCLGLCLLWDWFKKFVFRHKKSD